VRAPLRASRVQRALPFYISREARTWPLGPRQVGPTGAVNSNILFIHYGVAGEEDISPGFPCLFLESPVLVGTAPDVASGAACHVADRAV